MREGYSSRSVCVCICLSATTKSATYLIYMLKTRCHRVLYGVFKIFVAWLSLKTFCSSLASFAGHCHLPCSPTTSQRTKETAITSFQCEECACLAIAPIIRPTHHSSELTNCQFQHCAIYIVTADLALVARACGTATYCAIACSVHSCGY